MSRSTKKGPFVDAKLFKKVQEMNKNGEKIVLKTWKPMNEPIILLQNQYLASG